MVISEDDNESCSPRENSDDAKWEFRRSRIKSTLPEKIVFLVDIHEEMGEPWNSSYETRMVAIKDAIGKFVRRKNNSILKHLISLVTFKSPEEVNLLVRFTKNEDEITEGLKRISPEISISNNEFDDAENNKAVNESIDLAAVLSSVCNLLMLPSNMMSSKIVSNNKTCLDHDNNMSRSLASTYDLDGIVRCILIYGRSREVPMNKVDNLAKVPVYIPFLHHPDCYLDILYLHLKVNEEKVRCQEIYNVLCALARCHHPNGESGQVSNFSPYIFETHSSTIKLATHMAALLAHPVQREEAATMSARMDMNSLLAANIRHLIFNEDRRS